MKLSEDLIQSSEGKGFVIPFTLFILGCIWIIKTPKFDELTVYSGEIKANRYFNGIQLNNEETKFVFGKKSNKEKGLIKSEQSKTAKIWVVRNSKNRKVIKQLELDGELIFEYSYWDEIKLYIIFSN